MELRARSREAEETKRRRAAEVFADPKVENELCEDEKSVKAKERVVRKVESIFKKPHKAAGKLTLTERKFVEETGVDGKELSNEKVPVEAEDVLELPKGEKKRVRLTVGVSPEEGRVKKKSVRKKGDGTSGDMEGVASVTLATERDGNRRRRGGSTLGSRGF